MSRIFLLLLLMLSSTLSAQVQTVSVIEPQVLNNQQSMVLSGTIEAIHDASLAVQQAGLAKTLYKDLGDQVSKGEKLLQLDDSLARYQLQQLEAAVSTTQVQLAEASRLYSEALRLSKTQVVPETLIAERKARVAEAETTLQQAKASLGLQQEVLRRHAVYAPFDGIITARNGDIGEWLQPQSPVFNLVSNTQLRLRVAVPQEHYSAVLAYQQSDSPNVVVSIDNAKNQRLTLPIAAIVKASDPQTRTFRLLVHLPEDPQLISGMSANLQLDLGDQIAPLLWLPKSAVRSHPDGGHSVFSVQNNQTVRHIVRIERSDSSRFAVSGAPAGVPYVSKGVQLLQEGVSVNTTEEGDEQ
ncbi:efflux RND transporter periplasmic adaptor subunit [Planctobacterium marinum]|uniref:RND transporter MFP subunit n=1 Tax=Planctobacterium marinum TaxID=1631968 RepID=A0AA48HY73_9ALTE|nr:RND transporter MFP subunit [Planctobacterium marinum]